jgi:hypothetical protein
MWAWLTSLLGTSGSGATAGAASGAAGAGVTAGVGTSAAGTAASTGAGAAAQGLGAAYKAQVGQTLSSLSTKEGLGKAILTQGQSVQSGLTPSLSSSTSGGAVEGALAPAGSGQGATGAAAAEGSGVMKMLGMGGHSGGGQDNLTAIPEASAQIAPASQSQAAQLTGNGGGPAIPQAGVVGAQVSPAAQAMSQSEFNVGNVMKSLMGDSESFGKLLGTDEGTANMYMQRLQQQNAEAAERQKREREGLLGQQWRF